MLHRARNVHWKAVAWSIWRSPACESALKTNLLHFLTGLILCLTEIIHLPSSLSVTYLRKSYLQCCDQSHIIQLAVLLTNKLANIKHFLTISYKFKRCFHLYLSLISWTSVSCLLKPNLLYKATWIDGHSCCSIETVWLPVFVLFLSFLIVPRLRSRTCYWKVRQTVNHDFIKNSYELKY